MSIENGNTLTKLPNCVSIARIGGTRRSLMMLFIIVNDVDCKRAVDEQGVVDKRNCKRCL